MQLKRVIRCCKLLIIFCLSIFTLFNFKAFALSCDIILKNHIEINKDRVFLSDVSTLYPKKLRNQPILLSPLPNNTISVTKSYIGAILRDMGYKNLTICGNNNIKVTRKAFLITKYSVEKLINEDDLVFLTPMPIILPYSKAYTIRLNNIKQSKNYQYISIYVMKDGKLFRNISISVSKKINYLIPVANKDIRYGQIITKNDITIKKFSYIANNTITSINSIAGSIATTNINEYAPFTLSNTKRRKMVQFGNLVDVEIKMGSVIIRTQAKALQGGYKGDIIKILYKNSNRIVNALITGYKKVLIE